MAAPIDNISNSLDPNSGNQLPSGDIPNDGTGMSSIKVCDAAGTH